MIQTTDACCILRLSYIGYRTQYVNVKGSDVGTIQMEEDLPLLSEIIVKGQLPKTKLTGRDLSHQDDYTHSPYNWQGTAYYNGQAGKLNIDWNVDFMTNKENGVQTTRSRSHRLDISIRYTFNASKSKYKGTGAGQAERQRMSGN